MPNSVQKFARLFVKRLQRVASSTSSPPVDRASPQVVDEETSLPDDLLPPNSAVTRCADVQVQSRLQKFLKRRKVILQRIIAGVFIDDFTEHIKLNVFFRLLERRSRRKLRFTLRVKRYGCQNAKETKRLWSCLLL